MGKIFIDPLSDGGFKIVFGIEGKSEKFLIDFLNEIFADDPEFDRIVAVAYMQNERSPRHLLEREFRYDIYCTTSTGHHFVVEMQRDVRPNFEKRSAYYVAKAMADQARKTVDGRPWKYSDLRPVVGIFVLETHLPGKPQRAILDYQYREKEDHNEKLGMSRQIFIQLDYFNQTEEECVNRKEQWLYILKHLDNMEHMPFAQYKDQVFEQLDQYTRVTNLSAEERNYYDSLLKFYWDYNDDLQYSKEQGLEQGREQGIEREKLDTVKRMLKKGFDLATISDLTEVPINVIEKLQS